MIQGQINSMIAQVGNMAHVWKTLRNTETIKELEEGEGPETFLRKGITGEREVGDWLKSMRSAKDVAAEKPWLKKKENWNEEGVWKRFMKEFDEDMANQATQATASDLQARVNINSKVRKPSTVKTPGGNNNGN